MESINKVENIKVFQIASFLTMDVQFTMISMSVVKKKLMTREILDRFIEFYVIFTEANHLVLIVSKS